ncbi:MAG TPA: right-handed parallel beta-helix repeat-containing protein [Bacteroidales bacterium]|nr:right-handed parallel beta-helix repeat-containing protein [Bacteroidales bacterium]
MKRILLLFVSLFWAFVSHSREYHVSVSGNDSYDGSPAKPFRTINAAVQAAYPGDTVTVHAGTYREWINPVRGGESDSRRILYRAAPGERVEIKGSEEVRGWTKVNRNGVWKVVVPNSVFGSYNPYQDSVFGDWFNDRGRIHHTGELFLNGKSFYEKETLDKILDPVPDTMIMDREGSVYTWYCESNRDYTTIWANFHKFNPNRELTEISVRPTCIYPGKPGINYITIRGFIISQAATQWGAPTAGQVGMIATHWNKGWIIENNVIRDSKCSGITLGKEHGTGHNVWSADKGNIYNDGNIHYIEVTFRVLRNGWNKETTGSHIVRNNVIFNCEQTGICGSMGAAFSIIENNHIYNIWTKRQFAGAEIGGIKFHAAIDAIIRNNRIHSCGRGLWLDWMTQGTRVSANLFYDNDLEDIFLEVNHGPFIVDNNVFLSRAAIKTQSEGGAFVNNLIAGTVHNWPEPNRFTPYFLPHSTDMAGLTTIYGGDDRYYNNIFIGPGTEKTGENENYGLKGYGNARLPVRIDGNIYCNGATPSQKDENFLFFPSHGQGVNLFEEDGHGYVILSYDSSFTSHRVKTVTTEMLGTAKIPKADFDNPDGTVLVIDRDFFGDKRPPDGNLSGPFINVLPGENKFRLW